MSFGRVEAPIHNAKSFGGVAVHGLAEIAIEDKCTDILCISRLKISYDFELVSQSLFAQQGA